MKIYTASKVKHYKMWLELREKGYNIISTWIDEAGPGQTSNIQDLAIRCINEAKYADILLLYCEDGEILKGALVEAGAALAAGKLVHYVGFNMGINKVFGFHPLWKNYTSIGAAINQS